MKQGASISYKYNRTANGLWLLLLGIPLLVAYGGGIILIIIGLIEMRGSGTLRKLKKKGQEGYGKLAYKINEDKEPISSITRSRVSFYYELDNGLLGRTNQSINKKTRKALEEHKNGIVPIKKLGNQAVLDLDKLGTPVLDQKLEFSSQEPTHKYKYGEVTKKSIVLLILSVLFYIGGGVTADIIIANQSIPPQMKATIIIPVQILCFFLAILFYIIGASKLSYFGLAQKIRSDGEREDKQTGRLIKIVSKKNGNATFALPKRLSSNMLQITVY